jgi:hypothetical protein
MFEGKFITDSTTLFENTIVIDGRRYDYSIYMPDCGDVTIKVGTGVTLFNAGSVSAENCGAEASTLNFIVGCGNDTCATWKDPSVEASEE